jgi:hypothetical protein
MTVYVVLLAMYSNSDGSSNYTVYTFIVNRLMMLGCNDILSAYRTTAIKKESMPDMMIRPHAASNIAV